MFERIFHSELPLFLIGTVVYLINFRMDLVTQGDEGEEYIVDILHVLLG